ncbi:carbohydrate ABC transporter membrane protein 1, CUT1 family [Lachnospiraceae bacterium KH1T2]|nr:carbohydrate ABC transporter membrane protein 1, CUT1 family [Lachnospiraceae bacterium KH1T2]
MKEHKFIKALKDGTACTKISLILWGIGYICNGQVVKGVIKQLYQIFLIIFTALVTGNYILKLGSLGTVQREEVFDALTLTKKVNDYDNSLLILLGGIIGILCIALYVFSCVNNVENVYELQIEHKEGKHINSFREDIKDLLGKKFHITLLTLPGIGIVVIKLIPILFMICIAFTNYDKEHQPPTYLFTWRGLENFKTLFTTTSTITFGYVFARILIWTLIWAALATATTFLGGVFLAKFICDKRTKFPKLWRSLFVLVIAIPQFVTLLLVGKMFGDYGIINSFCNSVGITNFLQDIGVVSKGLSYIPFLSKPIWANIMVVLINIWVGVPFQMLSATGVIMNIPSDQLESAKIDGATDSQIFWKITIPYILFVMGPSLLTGFIANINNFNVIYLLTNDYVTTNMNYANSNAKEVDLLITWLFTLTNEYSNYKMASVIGICVFVICAAFTLISFSRMIAANKEEEYQ